AAADARALRADLLPGQPVAGLTLGAGSDHARLLGAHHAPAAAAGIGLVPGTLYALPPTWARTLRRKPSTASAEARGSGRRTTASPGAATLSPGRDTITMRMRGAMASSRPAKRRQPRPWRASSGSSTALPSTTAGISPRITYCLKRASASLALW